MSGPSASDLSSPAYGYGAVVAATEAALNLQIEYWEHSKKNVEFAVFWLQDAQGTFHDVDLSYIMDHTNQGNPLVIPYGTHPNAYQNSLFKKIGFKYGIMAKLGIPPGSSPPKNLIKFDSSSTKVILDPLFSDFNLFYFDSAQETWSWWKQTPDALWKFSPSVNIYQVSTVSGQSTTALGPEVTKRAQELQSQGVSFSIQSLMLDLTLSSGTQWTIDIPIADIPSKVRNDLGQLGPGIFKWLLTDAPNSPQVVLSAFTTNGAASSPVPVTSCVWMINPYVDTNGFPILRPTEAESRQATLNYLCATNGKPVPTRRAFTWNWVPIASTEYHGVSAISRDTLCDWVWRSIKDQVSSSCINFRVACWKSGAFGQNHHYAVTATPGQQPQQVDRPATGSRLLTISFSYSWWDHSDGWDGYISDTNNYSCTVDLTNDPTPTLKITQRSRIYLQVGHSGASVPTLDQTLIDTYTFNVTDTGGLVWTHTTGPNTNLYPDMNSIGYVSYLVNDMDCNYPVIVSNAMAGFKQVDLGSAPPNSSIKQDFFPGKGVFSFANIALSNNQDLVASLTYLKTY